MPKICLIEDEPYIVEALSYLFEAEGWEVCVVSDGAFGVDVVREQKPSLLVLDYMLPNRTGIEIATELRNHDEFSDLPVLMLTAKGQKKDMQQAEIAGITRFMTKPFSNTALIDEIRDLLHNSALKTGS